MGASATNLYKIILDSPHEVANYMEQQMLAVQKYRHKINDAYYYNWRLKIDKKFQVPFYHNHENMKKMNLRMDQQPHLLAIDLRKSFSAIVEGNIKQAGISCVAKYGPYEISGDKKITAIMDNLLRSFIEQGRMIIEHEKYEPCYRII